MNTASLILVLASLATAAEPAEIPGGHKDFYPTPEYPVGFRGDGNGYFPGATPVTEWREGTVGTKKSGAVDLLVTTDKKAHNVVWKVEMPSWANTQPIVVGDRVFTTAEPNLLVCVDAKTGKVLWTASANPWELIGVDKAQAEKLQVMHDIWREAIPHFEKMRGNGTMSRLVPSAEFKPIAEAFVQTTLPRITKRLKELDPDGPYEEAAKVTAEAVTKYGQLLVESEKKGEPSPVGKHDALNGQMNRLQDTLGQRINAYSRPAGAGRNVAGAIPLGVPWGHLVGYCMSVPVSDGQFVYASFGQGQTVCYDLNGKRMWGVHYQPNLQKDDLSSIASPLLAGDVLVDMHGSVDVIRGLDKRTGKLLWEAPTKGAGTRDGGGYYVGSHKLMRLANGPKQIEVIVTTLCNIIRASDGRVMGSLPFEFAPSGGPSIVCCGDVVMKGANGDNYRAPYIAYRLKLVGDDKVEAKEVWRTPRSSTPGYQAVVLSPKALIMASNQHAVLNPLTGEFLSRGSSNHIAGYSNTLAGTVFLWVDDGSRSWGSRGNEVFGTFSTADVTDPTRTKVISDQNVLGGVNKPRVPAMEKFAPELYALPFYTGNAYGWPAHFLHTATAIFPSGNRLFIRSLSHLYCIGDPAVPYDWNPASRPEKITHSLTVK
jgi:outer membrane protein assembly factor BamB